MTNRLVLQVADYQGPGAYRWRLYAGERLVAKHDVKLDLKSPELAKLLNLEVWLDAATNDAAGRTELAHLRTFVAERILGDVYTQLLQTGGAIVEVRLPAAAASLEMLPLEAAAVEGRALFGWGARLVFVPENQRQTLRGSKLSKTRILFIHSAEDAAARKSLLFQRLRREFAFEGRVLDVRTLGVGATRRMLHDALREPEAFDVVHIYGEKLETGLLLRKEDGRVDHVSAGDLLDLLGMAKTPPQLVVLSASIHGPPNQTSNSKSTLDDVSPYQSMRMLNLLSAMAVQTGGYVAGSRFRLTESFTENLWTEMYRGLFCEGRAIADAFFTARIKVLSPNAYQLPDLIGPILFGGSNGEKSLRLPREVVSHEEIARIHSEFLQDLAMAPPGAVTGFDMAPQQAAHRPPPGGPPRGGFGAAPPMSGGFGPPPPPPGFGPPPGGPPDGGYGAPPPPPGFGGGGGRWHSAAIPRRAGSSPPSFGAPPPPMSANTTKTSPAHDEAGEKKPWQVSKTNPMEDAPTYSHFNTWFPDSTDERQIRIPVGKPSRLCVNLGPPRIPEGAGQSSALDNAAIARIAKIRHLDVLVLCPVARVKPIRKRLPLPPDPRTILEFMITPLRVGSFDLEIVLLVQNEPIHRTSLEVEAFMISETNQSLGVVA